MRWLLPLLAVFALTACSTPPAAHASGSVDKLTVIDQKIGTGAEAKAGQARTQPGGEGGDHRTGAQQATAIKAALALTELPRERAPP